MADVSIKWTIGFNRFHDASDKTSLAIYKAIERAARDVVKNAQGRARVDTGYMRSQVRILNLGMTSATVGAMAPYSGYLDQGTRYIRPDYFFTNSVREQEGRFYEELGQGLRIAWGA